MFQIEFERIFGRDADPAPPYRGGWSTPEDQFTWSASGQAELVFPKPEFAAAYVVEIWVHPCIHPELHPRQSITVRVNGTAIGNARASGHSVLAFMFPGNLVSDELRLLFDFPDAIRPTEFGRDDGRLLGFGFSKIRLYRHENIPAPPILPPSDGDVLGSFESLGDNCEFGLLQRASGLEPLGLLRWSGQPLRFLVKALDERFGAFDDPASLVVEAQAMPLGYSAFVAPYHMYYHTFINPNEVSLDVAHAQQFKRQKFLRRKLLEDIEAGDKIMVQKRNEWLQDAEILPLYVALNRIGRGLSGIPCVGSR